MGLEKLNHGNHGGTNVLDFSIDGKPFKWDKQYITGIEIRKLGNISEEYDIFLKIKEPWKDEEINDDTRIDLARPERENFISKRKSTQIIIIIKGKPIEWNKPEISFAEVIKIAFRQYIDSPTMVYTVGYEDGPKENREGSMLKGSSVFVKNKMIFHATATDKS